MAVDNKIAEVVGKIVSKVEYDLDNKFGKYRYASADAVYQHVRKAISEAGLSIWQDEVDFQLFEREGGKHGVRATYDFGFSANGEKPDSVERRTQLGYFEGPQSVGALATYAEKYWLRGKLLLATGEKDNDEAMQDQAPGEQPAKDDNPVSIEFNGETLKYEITGGSVDRDRHLALYRALEVDFAKKERTEDELKRVAGIYEANRESITKLPSNAIIQVNKFFTATGVTGVKLVTVETK